MKTTTELNAPPAPPDLVRAVHHLQLRYAALMSEERRDYFRLLHCSGQALALAENLLQLSQTMDGGRPATRRPVPANAEQLVRRWTQERADLLERRKRDDEAVCRLIEGALSLCESLLPADQEVKEGLRAITRRRTR